MCQFAAASLCLPAAVGWFYGETVWRDYVTTAGVALVAALLLALAGRRLPGSTGQLTRREGFLAVLLSWSIMILFGAIPFYVSGSIPSLASAVFESTSGFTTTGATILTDIEALPRAHLFQRGLAHWIGGMGIIVLSVAILPELAIGGMQLFSAESSGISMDKVSPRVVSTARRLWQVYLAMTAVLVSLLMLGGLDWYDAVTHSFSTLATGGFSPHNASIAAFDSLYVEIVITIFMLAAAMNFALHYRVFVRRQWWAVFRSAEVGMFLGIFAGFALAIAVALTLSGDYPDFGGALRASMFQTASIITTTGYGTADFDRWPDFTRYLLVLLMFMGGCAGSTAGGVKVIRLLVVFKHATVELRKLLYPTLVHPVTIGRRAVSQGTIQAILGFFLLYIITTVVATMLVLATGVDLVSGVTAVISAMNSVGPALGVVGPAGNFSSMPDMCKWILSACMVVGRLEIYTVFVIFTLAFWKR